MKSVGQRVEHAARTVVLSLLRLYQLMLSPWLGNRCRFHPSCSQYCMEAVRRFGTVRGVGLGMIRLCKCHPFHPGGHDPVPDSPSV
jgi:putative membrane protein insertion efficiency factor